jgi:tetratricopeptide (TPR) repeat protein
MKLTSRRFLLVPLVPVLLLLLPAAPARAAIDPFYQSLLREGVQQYDLGDFGRSVRTLRLACFGMLDEPATLGSCLVRLALAQDRNDDGEGFLDTFRRLSDVEERFQGYTKADLSAELRADLERRLVARVPAAALRSVAAFRPLADRKVETKPAGGDGSRPSRRGQTSSPPVSPPPVAPSGNPGSANASGTDSGQPVVSQPAGPRPLTAEERDGMSRVRKVLAGESKVKDLRQAYDTARGVADAHPESVEAQHLAAEAAYRVSRWADAARYFQRGGEPPADQPELLFYMAVALYESGDQAKAAEILKRSLPNLQRTPYVDSYARKILG